MSNSTPRLTPQAQVAWARRRWRPFGITLARLTTLVFLDSALLALGLSAAFAIRALASRVLLDPLTTSDAAGRWYILCGVCWLAMFFYENLYRLDLQAADQSERLLKALTAGIVIAVLLTFLAHQSNAVSRSLLAGWYFANCFFFVLLRPGLRRLAALLMPAAQILVASDRGAHVESVCLALHRLGFQPREISLDSAPPAAADGAAVVICVGNQGAHGSLLSDWESRFHEVCIYNGSATLNPLGARPINLHGVQLFGLRHPLSQPLNRFCKRATDFLGALVALTLLAPLGLFLAVAIRLDSPGPILYRHRRLGMRGRPIYTLKFRTMVQDAEQKLQALLHEDEQARREFAQSFKLKRDPRITRIGAFLRRYSLDELPQLWNVLCGDMSLVGPRPIVDAEVAMYGDAYAVVSSVRPGMSGIWQVSGRSDVSWDSRRGFDVAYVRNWSLWHDLAILVRTVAAVILPNAY